jgi:hypothetical protein
MFDLPNFERYQVPERTEIHWELIKFYNHKPNPSAPYIYGIMSPVDQYAGDAMLATQVNYHSWHP